MNLTVTPVDGDGAIINNGASVVLIAAPVDPRLLDECRQHMEIADPTARLRSLAGAFLRHDVSAAAIDVHPSAAAEGTTEWSVFAVGAIDVVARDTRHNAADHPTGVSQRFAHDELLGVVAAGAELASATSWQRLGVGTIRAGGLALADPAALDAGARLQSELPPEPASADPQPSPASPAAPDSPAPAAPAPAFSEAPASDVDAVVADADAHGGAEGAGGAAFDIVSLSDAVDLGDRAPLPVEGESPAGDPAIPDAAGTSSDDELPSYARPRRVLGVLSPRGYFNHPEALYCSRTGVKMGASATKVLVEGDRPPLGVLTFDDGSTLSVQWPLVFGREPAVDPGVAAGEAAGHRLEDDRRAISRVHLRIELVDWDVLVSDADTANGTWIQQRQDASPRRLGAGERALLRTGDRVFLGDRSFTYHDHHRR